MDLVILLCFLVFGFFELSGHLLNRMVPEGRVKLPEDIMDNGRLVDLGEKPLNKL